MLEVQDLSDSENDEDDDEESDDEDEVASEGEQADDNTADAQAADETFDEEAFQKQMTDRLEAMRLNKALGNDDPDDPDSRQGVVSDDSDSDDSDTDSESGDSVGPAPTEFSSFDQNRRRKPAGPARVKGTTRADELKLTVAQQVGKEREMKEKRFHSKNSVNKAGNAKGHKWKKSEAFLVGKNSGW